MTPQQALATIPKKIKVGPHSYAVKVVDKIPGDDPDDRAFIDTTKQIILIVKDHATAAQVVGCAIHELLHAIWIDRDLGKRAEEERAVLNFESGLVQLFQDNPKLLTWIQRGLK